jgi:hypothetical protein
MTQPKKPKPLIITKPSHPSEEKYHGKAFTYNYMVDVFAKEIHNLLRGEK